MPEDQVQTKVDSQTGSQGQNTASSKAALFGLHNLFLLKPNRLPSFNRAFNRVKWTYNEAKYTHDLQKAGFLPCESWVKFSPSLQNALHELDEYFMPKFFQCDYDAKHYQNLYYLYRWLLTILAFFTGVGSIIILSASVADGSDDLIKWATVGTGLLGVLSGVLIYFDRRYHYQYEWYTNRSKTEQLRGLYFYYLADLMPDKYRAMPRPVGLSKAVLDVVQAKKTK